MSNVITTSPADPNDDQGDGKLNLPSNGGTMFDPVNGGPRYWCSFPATTETGFALLMQMKHGESKSIKEVINTVIEIRNVFITPASVTDPDTGEVTAYPRIVLECGDGSLYSCGSHGVFASLSDLLRFRPVTPWEPPIPVKVVAKPIQGGHQYFVLLYCPTVAPAPKKGGK